MSTPTALLAEVCEISMGQAPKGDTYNGIGDGLPLIAGAGDFGEIYPEPSKFTNAPTKVSQAGDIILCIRATIGDRNWANGEYCLGRGVAGLRPAFDTLDSKYLWHWLDHAGPVLKSKGRGATFLQVSKKDVASLRIPLPPLEDQKRIARILDQADALRAKRRESIEQLDRLLESVFLDMFGDPVTNPKGWEVVTVGDELEFLTSGSRGWAKYYADEGHLFIRIQNLKKGRLDLDDLAFVDPPESAEARRTRVQTGDVLLSITADLGRTAVVPEDIGRAHINQHLAILRFREMDPVFVSQQMATAGGQRQFERLNREGVKAGLNFKDVKGIQLLNPPLEHQQRFRAVVNAHEEEMRRLSVHLSELDTLFASLQSRAFNGGL